jgi:lambda repressor-like predicted transcriptional regulator
MHPAFIQAELKLRGVTQAEIAEKFDVSSAFVARLIQGRTSSHRIARFIARKLGREVHDLWPDRYHRRPRLVA